MKRRIYTDHNGIKFVFADPDLEAYEGANPELCTPTDDFVDGEPVRLPITGASMLGFVHDADYIVSPEHGHVLVCQ